MSAKIKFLIVIAIVIAVAAAAVISLFIYAKYHTLDKTGMIYEPTISEVSYIVSGDMEGYYYSAELIVNEGKTTVTITETPYNGAKETTKKARPSDISEIMNYLSDCDFMSWSDCPDSEIQALDEGTITVSICTERGRWNISSRQELPDEANGFFRNIKAMLESLTD